jgi:hypothetical protein
MIFFFFFLNKYFCNICKKQNKTKREQSKIAQIYYYDPQSAGINMQSPQSDLTPWTKTLGWGHGAKNVSRFVLFFADVIKIFIFLEKIKIKLAP